MGRPRNANTVREGSVDDGFSLSALSAMRSERMEVLHRVGDGLYATQADRSYVRSGQHLEPRCTAQADRRRLSAVRARLSRRTIIGAFGREPLYRNPASGCR